MRLGVVRLVAVAILAVCLVGAAPLLALCKDCLYDTMCVGMADGFGFRTCVQKQSCKTVCIVFEGDNCREWDHFDCVDIGCRLGESCSGFPY